jgi:arylsulfatase A-like enzyme
MIQQMDRGVGDVVAALERLGLAEQTFLFFFSDNGGTRVGSNGPLRGHKGQLWEGGHRVPAIAWWPGRIEPGSTCREPAISLDLMPTVLGLAGVDAPDGHRLDGVDLRPVLLEGRSLRPRTLFWSYGNQRAMRQGPWKLVQTGASKEPQKSPTIGLYHLVDDPEEARDLADQFPERVREMEEAVRAWEEEVAASATEQPETADD